MKKYLALIILIPLQVLSLLIIDFDTASIMGLWTMVYIYIFYRKLFGLEGESSTVSSGSYETVKGHMKSMAFNASSKEASYSIKYLNTKWLYLTMAIINGITTYMIMKVI